MSRKIFTFRSYNFPQPFKDMRVINIVIITPFFIAGIIWRINVDAIDSTFIFR